MESFLFPGSPSYENDDEHEGSDDCDAENDSDYEKRRDRCQHLSVRREDGSPSTSVPPQLPRSASPRSRSRQPSSPAGRCSTVLPWQIAIRMKILPLILMLLTRPARRGSLRHVTIAGHREMTGVCNLFLLHVTHFHSRNLLRCQLHDAIRHRDAETVLDPALSAEFRRTAGR
jgi:hypothetical protein